METQSQTPWYLDKKLYALVLGLILPWLSQRLGVQLDAAKVAGYVALVITYIVTHGTKSAVILLAEIKAKSLAAVAKDSTPATPQGAADALGKL